MEFNPLPASTGVIYKQWEKQPGETERLMGEVIYLLIYSIYFLFLVNMYIRKYRCVGVYILRGVAICKFV